MAKTIKPIKLVSKLSIGKNTITFSKSKPIKTKTPVTKYHKFGK